MVKLNLKTKLFTLISGMIVVVVFLTGLLSIRREEGVIYKANHERGLVIADNMARNSAGAIISRDPLSLLKYARHTMNQEFVTHVIILDPDGKVLMHNNLPEVGKVYADNMTEKAIKAESPFISEHYRSEDGDLREEIIVPVKVGANRIGTVRLGYSGRGMKEEIALARRQTVVMGIVSVLGGIIVTFVIATFISRPIKKLTGAAQKIAAGDLSASVDVKSGDEIGTLAATFNKMAETLEKTTVSRDYVDSIIRSMADTLIVLSPEGKIKTVNKIAAALLGYKKDELIGKPIDAILAGENPFKAAEFEKLVKEGALRNYETTYKAKDGGKTPMLLSVGILRTTDCPYAESPGRCPDFKEKNMHCEKFMGTLWIAKNITKYKELEEKLLRAQRLAVLGQLAGGVAHELRNPLGAINNAAYFLNLSLKSPKPEAKEALKILNREVAISDRIISSLLGFAHPRPPVRREVDLNSVVQGALSRSSIPENVEVVSRLAEDLPVIMADPGQLAQAFGNLILNAVQAMDGGGRLIIKSEVPGPEWVAVSISDTGVGIPDENLEKLFEPLFTTKAEGIGLGLSTVKLLIEFHGGAIEARSKRGKGSVFTVRLPAVPSPGTEAGKGEEK